MNDKSIFVWRDPAAHATRLAEDPTFAADSVRKAALSGDAGAQLSWALMLLDGHGAERDVDAAFRWFQLAARSGNRDAINMVGRCHELGWGTPVNLTIAARCYRAAAELGHAWAQFNLACLMLREDGVPGELVEALSLLARSARGGNPKAMNMLGRCCEEGWRTAPKRAAARRWYLRAARRGCFRGAFHSARLLIDEGHIDTAVAWLRRSIGAAPADFCEEIAELLARHPDERLRALSSLALEQAHRAPRHAPSTREELASDTAPAASSPHTSRRRERLFGRAVRRVAGAAAVLRR